MPAPAQYTYSAAAIVAANTALLGLIDAAATAGSIKVRDNSDVLLAQIPLTDPAGTVNGTTGQLTLTASAADDSADANGTAAYGEICDGDDNVILALPAQSGTAGSSGYIVINNLSINQGGAVSLTSAVIG